MNVVNTTKTVFRKLGIHLFALPAAVALIFATNIATGLLQEPQPDPGEQVKLGCIYFAFLREGNGPGCQDTNNYWDL